VFLRLSPEHIPPIVFDCQRETLHLLSSWQQAVTRLGDLLPISSERTVLNAEDFQDFMFQVATPAFSFADGRIRWRVSLFISREWVHGFCPPPCLERKENAENEEREWLAKLPQIKTWLLGLSVTDSVLLNALCMVVPFIADLDPPFVKLALDPETWRSIVSTNTAVTEVQRRNWSNVIDNWHFGHVINNAMLHVLGALANNHFMLIRDYLDHPCLYGHYSRLMPHYLFALLFQKVSILRQLATDHDAVTE